MQYKKIDSANYSKWSFQRGLDNVRSADYYKVRNELKTALGITTNPGFKYRVTGTVIPKGDEIEKIETIFHKYGVFEIWGPYES